MKTFSLVLFISLFFIHSTQAIEVSKSSNKESCTGLILSFFRADTNYVSLKGMPALPSTLAGRVYPDQAQWGSITKYRRIFFESLISREVKEDLTNSVLKNLKEGELYTFVLTDKDMRFAETSRGRLSPKNFASKHGMLAKGDKVHFAGEAWLEEGILVVNNNSGTYKPDASFLADLAMYLQKSFNVEKVTFSDVIPVAKSKNLSEYISELTAYIKSRKANFSEGVVNLLARNNYLGAIFGDEEIKFKVGKFIGSGFFGVIHKIEGLEASDALRKSAPQLFADGKLRLDLVAKFPQDVPLLSHLPSVDIFNRSIIKENDELVQLKEILKDFDISSADILYMTNYQGKNVAIKKLVHSESIQTLSKISKTLSKKQSEALKKDIYEMAEVVQKKLNLFLDIKAENIAWDPISERFIMYELSIRHSDSFVDANGFNGYLNYVNKRLGYYNQKRKPASLGNDKISLCTHSNLKIPPEFKFSFTSALIDGELNLADDSIQLNQSEIEGCFHVKSLTFIKNIAQINLTITSKKHPENILEFAILRDLNNSESFMAFTLWGKQGELAHSLVHPSSLISVL